MSEVDDNPIAEASSANHSEKSTKTMTDVEDTRTAEAYSPSHSERSEKSVRYKSEVDEAPMPEGFSPSNSEKSSRHISHVDRFPIVGSYSSNDSDKSERSVRYRSDLDAHPNDASLIFDNQVLDFQEQRSTSIDIRDDRHNHQTEVKIGPLNNEVLDKRGRRQVLPDPSLTVALGGYSFEAYSDPTSLGMTAAGLDGTDVTFTSLDYLQRVFSGALLITVIGATLLNKDGSSYTTTGGGGYTPYITLSVHEDEEGGPTVVPTGVMRSLSTDPEGGKRTGPNQRVLSSVTTTKNDMSSTLTLNETHCLFVKKASTASVLIRAFDCNPLLEEDVIVGSGVVPFREFHITQEGKGETQKQVTVPIYARVEKEGLRGVETNKKISRQKSGNLSQKYGDKSSQKSSQKTSQKNGLREKPDWDIRPMPSVDLLVQHKMLCPSGSVTIEVRFLPLLPIRHIAPALPTDSVPIDPFYALYYSLTHFPKVYNPSLLSWLEVLSNPPAMYHEQRRMSLLDEELKKIRSTQSINIDDDESDLSKDAILTKSESMRKSQKDNSKMRDRRKDEEKKKEEIELDKKLVLAMEHAFLNSISDSHHRITRSISKKIYLPLICCVENKEHKSRASVWADMKTREVIISFRGCETADMGEFVHSQNIVQESYEASNKLLSKTNVHKGFMTIFRSMRGALMQVLHSLLTLPLPRSEDEPFQPNLSFSTQPPSDTRWQIYVTGHSLGGALATLFAFELGRLRAGLWGTITEKQTGIGMFAKWKALDDPADMYRYDRAFLSSLRSADLTSYTYGSPRVGTPNFCKVFDELVPNCFRVVNYRDIVPEVPRTHWFNIFMQYDHVGRPLHVSTIPQSAKHNPVVGFILSMKESEYVACIQDKEILARHQSTAYFKATCRNAGRSKTICVQVGL